MGTHPSGPSMTYDGAKTLEQWLKENPAALGDKTPASLPFLFKVLSVRTALSIQAHPDKQLAEKLHAERPDVYKDPNHKPEMSVALTEFEALCNFREARELVEILATVPELVPLVTEPTLQEMRLAAESSDQAKIKLALRTLYTALMAADAALVEQQTKLLVARLGAKDAPTPLDKLVIRLNEQYPGDVGVFSVFFLNYLVLQPGQAFFMGPNMPHAYIKGNCLEVMACSDNVVRAGCTPKYKDVETLTSMLTYESGMPQVMNGVELKAGVLQYEPASLPGVDSKIFNEFQLQSISVPAKASVEVAALPGPAIALNYQGVCSVSAGGEAASAMPEGSVFLVGAVQPLSLSNDSDSVAKVCLASCASSFY